MINEPRAADLCEDEAQISNYMSLFSDASPFSHNIPSRPINHALRA